MSLRRRTRPARPRSPPPAHRSPATWLPPHQARVAGRISRRDHQQSAALVRKSPYPPPKALLDGSEERCRARNPNPPASSAGVNPLGSSSIASGFLRVSAKIRTRTRASSGPVSAESSSARASSSRKPSITSSGNPAAWPDGWRAARPGPPILLPGGAPRTRALARRRDRASTGHRPGRSAAPPRLRRTAGPARPSRPGTGPERTRS
jgi:hypothetical protein